MKRKGSVRCAYRVAIITSNYEWDILFRQGRSYNLDELLHRGKYSIKKDHHIVDTARHNGIWEKLKKALGYSNEFTRGDRLIYGIIVGQMTLFVGAFVVMTSLHFVFNFTDNGWANFFHYKLWYYIAASFIYSI